MRPHHHPGSIACLALTILALFLFALPEVVSGAIPPQSPEVAVSISNTTVTQGVDTVITVEWHRREASLLNAPEEMHISVFSIPDARIITSYAISRDEEQPAEGNGFGRYQGLLRSAELPAGRLMIVAADPLSGSSDRLSIEVTGQGVLYPSALSLKGVEGLFFGVAWICMILPGAMLVLLTRKSAGS